MVAVAIAGIRGPQMISLHGVCKRFGGVQACQDISFKISPGDVIAIAGENGAGKSTVSKCLYGLYSPTEGHIEVDGIRVEFGTPADGEAAGIVMIPQELDLFPELSISNNVWIGQSRPRTRFGSFDYEAMEQKAREHLLALGLDVDVRLSAKHLSAANGKLLEIARALNVGARVVIMDEPTASLTEREVGRLLSVVRSLQASGVSVIYITHRLEEIFAISNRIVVLRDGQLIADASTAQETQNSLVKKMVGRPVEDLFSRHQHDLGEVVLQVASLSVEGAFEDVSFTLRKGEILGISGLIGAGRSELAEALFGIRSISAGTIKLEGKEVGMQSVSEAFSHGIGMVPEERRAMGLILEFSIKDNISFSSLDHFKIGPFINKKAENEFAQKAATEITIIGAALSAPVSALSGGNQQKAVIAKVLARKPKILILDEPTRGVDIGAKSEIYRIIDDLAKQGHAVLMISSELNEIIAMCDRTLVMREGRLVANFERANFTPELIGAACAGLSGKAND